MDNLSNLLKRFYSSLDSDKSRKEIIVSVIEQYTKGRLDTSQVLYKEGLLEIEAGPVMKNEIKLKEEKILKELSFNSIKVNRVLYK